MSDMTFFASRWTVWKVLIVFVGILLTSGVLYQKDPMSSVVLLVTFGLLMARGLLRRSRPLVEISGDELTWRSMVGIGWGGTIALDEVAGVDLKYLWYLVVKTRSGKRRWIDVGEIERSQRGAARDAIAERLTSR